MCSSDLSLFLKSAFGVGYNMTIEKKDAANFNSGAMIEAVTSRIETANLLNDVGAEVTFQLPLSSSNLFQPLFEHIDDNQEALGVQSYGTTLHYLMLCSSLTLQLDCLLY